jgi:hypothetical protein
MNGTLGMGQGCALYLVAARILPTALAGLIAQYCLEPFRGQRTSIIEVPEGREIYPRPFGVLIYQTSTSGFHETLLPRKDLYQEWMSTARTCNWHWTRWTEGQITAALPGIRWFQCHRFHKGITATTFTPTVWEFGWKFMEANALLAMEYDDLTGDLYLLTQSWLSLLQIHVIRNQLLPVGRREPLGPTSLALDNLPTAMGGHLMVVRDNVIWYLAFRGMLYWNQYTLHRIAVLSGHVERIPLEPQVGGGADFAALHLGYDHDTLLLVFRRAHSTLDFQTRILAFDIPSRQFRTLQPRLSWNSTLGLGMFGARVVPNPQDPQSLLLVCEDIEKKHQTIEVYE